MAAVYLFELAHALPKDVYRAKNGYNHNRVHHTFVHLLGSDHFWHNALASVSMPDFYPEDVADIDALISMLEIERKGWHELLDTCVPVWHTLQHVILHNVQYHTELARMLTDAGHSPGDLVFCIRR